MNRFFKVNSTGKRVARIIAGIKTFESIWKIKMLLFAFTFVFVNATLNAQCAMSCNNGLQISISGIGECDAVVDAGLMLANSNSCPGPKTITITNQYGQTLPQTTMPDGSVVSTIGVNNIGQTLLVTVADPASGNSCWGYVTVEDKIAPVISDCDPVSVYCFQNTDPITLGGNVPVPTASDCSWISSNYYDEFVDEECAAAVSASINRHWTFTDAYGNFSTCIQVINIEQVSITAYTPVCPGPKYLECNTANPPSILPEDTGFPYIDIDGNPATTDDLFVLDNNLVGHCELGISYSDEIFDLCGNSYKAIRTWTVFDWCAPTQAGVNPWTCLQVIKVEDTTPPVISPLSDITVGTGSNSCSAVLILPSIQATDNCSDNIEVITVTTLGTLNSNGGVVPFPGLPLGNNVISYIATDECGNSSTYNFTVTVVDNAPPVVVCDVITSVSLQPDGTAIIYAQTFDDGSHDNCGIASYEVQRMTNTCSPQTPFGPYVSFSCCDIENGPVTVAMQVTDIHGNSNLCMINVNVQDKVKPVITCPSDKYLDCFETWTDLDLTGTATATDACGIDTIYHQDYGSVNECGYGNIQRVWTAIDHQNNTSSCTQWIYVSNHNPFSINNISWPPNYTSNTCGGGLEPENLPAPFNEPIITEGYCDLIAVTHEDTYLPITVPACFKILRRWIIVDWCEYDPNDPNTSGYYTYNQIVKVLNSEAPVFTSDCEPQSICSYEENCGPTLITLTASGTDDCTAANQLNFSYEVDVNFDGILDFEGNGHTFQGYIGLGTHWIKWYLEDGCGNLVTCDYVFVVADCKNPTPYCLNGIAVDLMPNTGSISLWATDFDAGSYDNCGIVEYRIYSPSLGVGQNLPPVGSTNNVTFDCDDLGNQSVDFWILDTHGNWAYCTTYVIIQDNAQVCNDNTALTVSGYIENEEGVGVENVSINISGSNTMSLTTGANGSFTFPDLDMGGNYTVAPEKDFNYLNGVSTIDLVLLSRHILGINYLDSPYKMIAGDVNKSGSVSTIDIVLLRKVILQINDSFSNNKSWRFIEADFVFPDPSNPFANSFPEVINLNGLDQNAFADFVAVKIGDVNCSANPANYEGGADNRHSNSLDLTIKDQKMNAGDIVKAEVFSKDFKNINGFQFTLELDQEVMSMIEINTDKLSNFDTDNYNLKTLSDGIVTVSWHSAQQLSMEEDEVLFELVFEVKQNSQLSEVLNISSSRLNAEIYQSRGDGAIDLFGLGLNYIIENDNIKSLTNSAVILNQNAPNPFKESTRIPFYIPERMDVSLTVLDLNGSVLWKQIKPFEKGWNDFELMGSSLNSSGILYYQLEAGDFKETRKLILIK